MRRTCRNSVDLNEAAGSNCNMSISIEEALSAINRLTAVSPEDLRSRVPKIVAAYRKLSDVVAATTILGDSPDGNMI